MRAWIAGGVSAALIAGVLVAAGVGAQNAEAASPAPGFTIAPQKDLVAGEDLSLELTFTSAGAAAGDQYNVSAGLVIPADVTYVGASAGMTAPKIYAAGKEFTTAQDCAAIGLESGSAGKCRVPAGKQYLVFENITDLPVGAKQQATVTLRPNAQTFPVGTTALDIVGSAYTSNDPSRLPQFPGSTAKGSGTTSAPGISKTNVPVKAFRVAKSEPSPEGELLRGIHDHTTTYTLRISHTAEGDLSNTQVTDFLPAGLEFLGTGGIDHTTNANGAQGAVEYPGAARLTATPAPAGGAGAAGAASSVETIKADQALADQYGLEVGKVYTKVTWNLGTLLGLGDPRDTTAGVKQNYASAPGTSGVFEIRYRAGIPLFENTLDFGATTPSATSGDQAANLDNNRGASTRHGISGDPYSAQTLRNVAAVSGSYAGKKTESSAAHSVDAVDVRLLKSVSTKPNPDPANASDWSRNASFTQGQIASYRLNIATSEYVGATQGGAPDRLVDDMADGVCPAFPAGTAITGGGSTPKLTQGGIDNPGAPMSASDWNAMLADRGVSSDCSWPSTHTPASDLKLAGATLTSLSYNPSNGHFSIELALAPADALAAPNREHNVVYTVMQSASYTEDDGQSGATSSGDRVTNNAKVILTTDARPELDGIVSKEGAKADGREHAADDSSATLEAALSGMQKRVLPRDAAGQTTAANVASATGWVDSAKEPFSAGDQVWYKISVTPPAGADVRNAKLTDFLPEGVTFDETKNGNAYRDIVVVPSASSATLGICTATSRDDLLQQFVGQPTVGADGRALTWSLGKTGCLDRSSDRFFPRGVKLDVYVKVTVSGLSDFGDVDLPQNLAKYQQENVDGEIFFLRDGADITVDGGTSLVKGVRSLKTTAGTTQPGAAFGSNVDGLVVAQGVEATYRIDLAAPRNDTADYRVLDALPEGVRKADLKGIDPSTGAVGSATAALWNGSTEAAANGSVTAKALDPGDPGYADLHLTSAYAGRTVIVFTFAGTVPGATPPAKSGLTLGYTLVVPSGVPGGGPAAQLTQSYENTAAISNYSFSTNSGDSATVVPQKLDANGEPTGGQLLADRTVADGEFGVDDSKTHDTSEVHLPGTAPAKRLVSTEVGPSAPAGAGNTVGLNDIDSANSQTQIVQGEHATFEYRVKVPAHTTVRDAKLADNGFFMQGGTRVPYEFVAGSAAFSGPNGMTEGDLESAGFTLLRSASGSDAAGTLLFPAPYTNSTDQDQEFTARITVWVKDRDASHTGYSPDLANGAVLQNTAAFSYANPADPAKRVSTSANANATYIEPGLRVVKTANPNTDVQIGKPVQYTITVSNPAGRAKSYENTVVDQVPAGLIVDLDSLTLNGAPLARSAVDAEAGVSTGAGGKITWKPADVPALQTVPATVALGYTAMIDPSTGGGQSYSNTATATGYTLPKTIDGADTSDRRGDRTTSSTAKITATTAAIAKGVRIGDSGAYAKTAQAPIGETASYQVKVTLHPNINYYNAQIRDQLPAGVELIGTPTVSVDPAGSGADGGWTWAVNGANRVTGTYTGSDGDIASSSETRTLTVTYRVLLKNTVAAGVNSLPNTAGFSWTTAHDDASQRIELTDNATVNVLNPQLGITKRVNGASAASVDPGDTFTYTVDVRNTGTSPAYNAKVTDTVPSGVVVDPSSLTASGGVLTGAGANGGGTITWDIAGPLSNVAPNNVRTFTYTAKLTSSDALKQANLVNEVAVKHYESFANGGRSYDPTNVKANATVTPRFPNVTLQKSTSNGSEAFVGDGFGWTLQAKNTGQGAAQTVRLTDTLPKNWEFDASVRPQISIGGGAFADLDAPTIGTKDGKQTLTWNLGSAAPAQALLPGVGSGATDPQRTVRITFSAKPQSGATTDAGAGLSIAHTNTLSGQTTDATGKTANADGGYTGPDATADAHIARVDLKLVKEAIGGDKRNQWTAGAVAGSGYTQPQWRITVTNQGPDAASGQFSVVDQTTLPAGVTTGAFTARYYANAADKTGTPLTLSGAGTAKDPFVVGDRGTRLAADGSDRIVLLADVTIDAASTGTAKNDASVTGRSFERQGDIDKDNSSTAQRPITTEADLAIDKVLNTAEPSAGRPISWGIKVSNRGPSVSASTADKRITVTDTIPAGISDVRDPSAALTSWTVTASNGWPAKAGDTITWTFTGPQLPVGPAQELTLDGMIDSSWTGGKIVNTAVVHPGATTDPVTDNNTDDVSTTPGDGTTLGISKTRVVNVGGVWKDAAENGGPLPDITAGGTVSYRITVANLGPADARAVRVVDTAPSVLSYREHANLSGTWTWTAGANASTDQFALAGTIAKGASRTFVATYDIDPSLVPGSTVRNWAQAFAENSDNEPKDDDQNGNSDRQADLSITKQALDLDGNPTTKVTAGTELRYRITVKNNGPSVSGAPIKVTDDMPAGMTYVSSTSKVDGITVNSAPQVSATKRSAVWTMLSGSETLQRDGEMTFDVVAAIAPDVPAQRLVNGAGVGGPDDTDPTNNHAEATVEVVTEADMTIAKDVEAGPWVAGTDVTYTLTVENRGPSVADAFVEDVLPEGLTPVSISGAGWTCDDAAESCKRAAHPVGTSTLTVVAHVGANVPTGTELTNTAFLSWTDSRSTAPHQVKDDATITVTTSADLSLEKTAIDADGTATDRAVAGSTARYRMVVTNHGPSDAIAPITVTDTLPAGSRFVSLDGASATDWTATAEDPAADGTQRVTFARIPDGTGLANGAAAPAILFTVQLDAGIADGAKLTNTATAKSGTPDPDESNNTDTAEVTVDRRVDVAVTKSHDAAQVRIGSPLEFGIDVVNHGPSIATGVSVTDRVPVGLKVTSTAGDLSGDRWTITEVTALPDGGTLVVATLSGELAPGERAPKLTVGTEVQASAYSDVTNTATVTSTEEDVDRDNNRSDDPVKVPALAKLTVTKSAQGEFQVGDNAHYRITVRNDGPTEDPGPITVTDRLPNGLTYVSSAVAAQTGGSRPVSAASVQGSRVEWTLPKGLAKGEQVTIDLVVRVGQAAYPKVENTAVVSTPTDLTPDSELTSTVGTKVKPIDPLAVTGGAATGYAALIAALLLLVGGAVTAVRRRRDGTPIANGTAAE